MTNSTTKSGTAASFLRINSFQFGKDSVLSRVSTNLLAPSVFDISQIKIGL